MGQTAGLHLLINATGGEEGGIITAVLQEFAQHIGYLDGGCWGLHVTQQLLDGASHVGIGFCLLLCCIKCGKRACLRDTIRLSFS